MILVSEDLKRIHGLNERISVENYKNGIRFYYQLIKNIDFNYLNE
jgi:carboxypeptidase PM20D1